MISHVVTEPGISSIKIQLMSWQNISMSYWSHTWLAVRALYQQGSKSYKC